jgi:hypothetical protein
VVAPDGSGLVWEAPQGKYRFDVTIVSG